MNKALVVVVALIVGCGGKQQDTSPSSAATSGAKTERSKLEIRITGESAFLTNADLTTCTSGKDAESGTALVKCELTPAGGKKLADTTTAGAGKVLEIVVDGKVMSSPTIIEPMTAGRFSISIGTDEAAATEAARLAAAFSP